ncbi:24123_t:CDS:2, partial [Gigaspora rosea]
ESRDLAKQNNDGLWFAQQLYQAPYYLQNSIESSLYHSMFLASIEEELQLMNEKHNEIDHQDEIFNTNSSDKKNDKLYIKQSFMIWKEAEEHLNNYGKKDLVFRENKVTLFLKMKVNGSMSKKIATIIFTTVMNKYNYLMIPLATTTTTITKYYKLNNDMIQFIEFCIKSGILDAQPIGQLLKSKFQEIKIHQKPL